MKRTALIRRIPLRSNRPHRPWARADEDKVSPEMALAVFARDGGCMAPRLGGSVMDCFGRDRIEHVKAEPRMGKRAEPVLACLITLCQGHTEDGMRAGYVWATAAVNRRSMREYLSAFEE